MCWKSSLGYSKDISSSKLTFRNETHFFPPQASPPPPFPSSDNETTIDFIRNSTSHLVLLFHPHGPSPISHYGLDILPP